MRYLLIAEKPSLKRDIEKCYQNHKEQIVSQVGYIDFIALAGHVCTNYEPNDYPEWNENWDNIQYPMIPQRWKIKASNSEIIDKIKKIIHNYDGIIVGTDSDVEGYGIYYLLEQYLHLSNLPTLRFIEHSLTDAELLKSLLSMTDYHTDPVHQRFTKSFLLRSRADWLYGMNVTRMMTVQSGTLMTVGRVKAPTIKLIYDNSMAIENFKQEKYYQVEASYGKWKALMCGANGKPLRFNDKITDNIDPEGVIEKKEEKTEYTHCPRLYDLSAIQSEAGQKFGYSPTQVLTLVQSLYEQHKLISYPRTQCRFVSSEKAKEFPSMLEKLYVFEDLGNIVSTLQDSDIRRVYDDSQVVNDREVLKESHDALLPTDNTPNLDELTEDEINILKMIYTRLLAQFLPQLQTAKTKYLIRHGEHYFISYGRIIVEQGWRILYGDLKNVDIPNLSEGESITAIEFSQPLKSTNPPKRLTQATLIKAMKDIASLIEDRTLKKSLADSQGIGTPATRAAIIKDIIDRGYVKDKKGLYITAEGKEYIENLKEIDIVSPVFAAILDTKIKKIQRGELEYDSAYEEMLDDLKRTCKQIENITGAKETKIQCPNCKKNLIRSGYNYICQSCDFKIPRRLCGVELTEDILTSQDEMSKKRKFKSKNGKTFYSKLKFSSTGIEFDFSSGIKCPFCGSDVTINKAGVFCDCGLKIFNPMCNRKFSNSEIKELLDKRILKNLTGFKTKSGDEFNATVYLSDEKNVRFK